MGARSEGRPSRAPEPSARATRGPLDQSRVSTTTLSMCQRDSPQQQPADMKMDKAADKTKPKVSETRKIRKPLMEKRRRARINDCLNELKSMLLDADTELKQQSGSGSRPAKLEKADILEMTVRHVRRLQCAARTSSSTTGGGTSVKFETGFAECATEVHSELGRIENVDPQLKQRLGSHLGACLSEMRSEEPSAVVSSSSPSPPPTPLFAHKEGFTLVPTKLPNGDLAFVIPADMQVLRQTGGTNKLVLKTQMDISEPLMWRPW